MDTNLATTASVGPGVHSRCRLVERVIRIGPTPERADVLSGSSTRGPIRSTTRKGKTLYCHQQRGTMRHLSFAIAAAVLVSAVVAASARDQTATPATPENAAAFLGEWAISANGSYGPIAMAVIVKAADGKVVGEVADPNGKHTADASKSGTSLVLSYVFDYQGNPIDAVITLTPNEKAVAVNLDFAGGAAQFTGTATKK